MNINSENYLEKRVNGGNGRKLIAEGHLRRLLDIGEVEMAESRGGMRLRWPFPRANNGILTPLTN